MCWCLWLIYTDGVIDCNEWNTEKSHESSNMGKVKQLQLWWQLCVTWLLVRNLGNIRPLDFCWTECTTQVRIKCFICKFVLFDELFLLLVILSIKHLIFQNTLINACTTYLHEMVFSEKLLPNYQNTPRHIPEHCKLQRHQNLILLSHTPVLISSAS